MVLAHKAFGRALRGFTELRRVAGADKELADILHAGAVVAYCRPFKQKDKALRFPTQSIPAEHLELHQHFILVRDKILAHEDRVGPHLRGRSATRIDIFVEHGRLGVETQRLSLTPAAIDSAILLCRTLVEKAKYHAQKEQTRLFRNARLPDGKYELNLDQGTDTFTANGQQGLGG